jgi:hypothetical protein
LADKAKEAKAKIVDRDEQADGTSAAKREKPAGPSDTPEKPAG